MSTATNTEPIVAPSPINDEKRDDGDDVNNSSNQQPHQNEDTFQTRLQSCVEQINSKRNVDEARTRAATIAREALDIERQGDADEAIRILTLGTELFSRDPPVRAIMYNNLACVEKRCGRTEDALFHLEAAVECEGGEDLAPPSTLLNLSAAVLSLGYFAASVRVAHQAMRRILSDTKPARDVVVGEIKRGEAKLKRAGKDERDKIQQDELKQRDSEKDKEEAEELNKKLSEKSFKAESVNNNNNNNTDGNENPQPQQQKQQKPLWTLKEIEKLEECFRLTVIYRQDQDFSDEIEYLFAQEEKQIKDDAEEEKKRPPLSPYLGLSGPQLVMLATAKYNLGISLREMGDIVKGRHALEFALDVFASDDNLGKFPENHPQIERLKSSVDAALALPYHEGGTTPARAGSSGKNKMNNNSNTNSTLVPYNNHNADGSSAMNETSIAVQSHRQGKNIISSSTTTPSTKSKSKFSKLRGFSSTPQPSSSHKTPPQKKPTWDNTTTFGTSVGAPGAGAAQFYARKSSNSDKNGQLQVPTSSNVNSNSVTLMDDPSIETKLAGTYVPLRLVRLTEEVRFRESCRRIALARARLEDMRDFKLLMKRERCFAEEEEERVDIEVEQERLLGVTEYWIQFRILLIQKTTALAEQVMLERSKIIDEYEAATKRDVADSAQELRFRCVQDTERFALCRQQEDGLAVISKQFAERNAYFEAKAKLNRAQLQALACALSCWAIDNAMRGENTTMMLRTEMQQSPIVLMRSLTFGQGKWASGR